MCGTGIVIFLIFEQALYFMSFQSICTIKRNTKTGAELKLAGVETNNKYTGYVTDRILVIGNTCIIVKGMIS